jgi:hypothetical protein
MNITLKNVIILITFVAFSLQGNAQNKSQTNQEEQINSFSKTKNKGKAYFFWGWNWAQYSRSDITFKGDNYNFTLNNVPAHDKQTDWDANSYLNPANMTLPQTNVRLGYYFHDNWNLSFGLDHMKYVVDQFSTVKIKGEINLQNPESPYNGNYNNDAIVLEEDFLMFEHTDGLNYVNIEIARVDNLGDYLKWNSNKIQLNITESLGVGALYPKTNTTLLDQERYDEFNVAGYGLSLKGGLNITFFNHFFVQGEFKAGYINMPNIRTTEFKSDSAKQDFFFYQRNFSIGYVFQLVK